MMNDQILDLEKKMDLFIKETRDNFGKVFEDRNEMAEKQDDIYRKEGALDSEFELFKDEIQKHTKTVKKEHDETRDAIAGSVEAIEESLVGKTKIVVKEVDKPVKHWYQVWKRTIKE